MTKYMNDYIFHINFSNADFKKLNSFYARIFEKIANSTGVQYQIEKKNTALLVTFQKG